MDLIVDKTIRYRTYRKDFGNGIIFVQHLENVTIKDEYFALAGDVYPDGTMRPFCPKLFYSPLPEEEAKKELGLVKPETFKWFDKLYYIDGDGLVAKFSL
tara:strand:+ start:559 stop:858 length:300 start_codon:yes stop_codon:yes gene_type:complete